MTAMVYEPFRESITSFGVPLEIRGGKGTPAAGGAGKGDTPPQGGPARKKSRWQRWKDKVEKEKKDLAAATLASKQPAANGRGKPTKASSAAAGARAPASGKGGASNATAEEDSD
jgi:hypothetical protein